MQNLAKRVLLIITFSIFPSLLIYFWSLLYSINETDRGMNRAASVEREWTERQMKKRK